MKPIHVLALTGIRSEYDIIYPILNCLQEDDRFRLSVAVSGAHLSNLHDRSIGKIEADGFRIVDRLDSLFNTDRPIQRAKTTGILTYAFAQTVERENPQFILIEGDREECLAAAIVGNYTGTLVAHSGGGDTLYGHDDDSVRFAVAKLAHLHFPICQAYANNLLAMGEEDKRVFVVGNPALDKMKTIRQLSRKEIAAALKFPIDRHDYLLVLQHPYSSEVGESYNQMKVTLSSIEAFIERNEYLAIGIHPNGDPGSEGILRAIDESSGHPKLRFYKNLERDIFVGLLGQARVLIGNSSMGIVEAPFFKLPAINVGSRQSGRINAGNVLFVGHDREKIIKTLEQCCLDQDFRNRITRNNDYYGDGNSAPRIRDILADLDLTDPGWLIKGLKS